MADDDPEPVTLSDGDTLIINDDGTWADLSPDGGFVIGNADGSLILSIQADGSGGFTIGDLHVGWGPAAEDSGGVTVGDVHVHWGLGKELNPDSDSNQSDTGIHPRFWGSGDVKDVFDISDTGTIFRVLGQDSGPPTEPWDRTDDGVRRIKVPGAGTVTVEAWDKIGPKFRPMFHVVGDGRINFGVAGLARVVGSIFASTIRDAGGG